MRKILLSLVVFILAVTLIGLTGPSASWATEWKKPEPVPDTQRFQPEPPGQAIKKANEDAERYQKVPPPGGKVTGAETKKSVPKTEEKK